MIDWTPHRKQPREQPGCAHSIDPEDDERKQRSPDGLRSIVMEPVTRRAGTAIDDGKGMP